MNQFRPIYFLLVIFLFSCSEYKSLMKDGKTYEDARMFDKALANYNKAYAIHAKPESLIARKRITEQVITTKYAQPIRLATAQGALSDATTLYAQLEDFVIQNKELEVIIPIDLKSLIDAARESWYKSNFAIATQLAQDANYDDALVLLQTIRYTYGNTKELDYLENLCKVMPAYYEAEKAFNENNWREAYKNYSKVILLDPSFKDAKEKQQKSLESGRVRVAYVSVDTKSVSGEVERELGAYINQGLLENKDPFLQLLDRDYTQKIMEEQQMVMSGLYDEKSVIQAGKLTGAKYILLGEVIDYKESHTQENFGVRKGFLGKSTEDKRIKYQMWNDQFRVISRIRISLLDAESGESLFTTMLPCDSTVKVIWAEFRGDNSMVYPGNWKWELINSREDYVDFNGYEELQQNFSNKPNSGELTKLSQGLFIQVAKNVKQRVSETFN